jgi:cytochrome c6
MASHVGRVLQTRILQTRILQARILQAVALLLVVLLAWWPLPAQASPDGALLFDNHCAGCHIHGGNIIRRGKTLQLGALERQGLASPEAIARVAAAGIGQMGGYATSLGDGGPEAVADYVWQQAQAGWPRA